MNENYNGQGSVSQNQLGMDNSLNYSNQVNGINNINQAGTEVLQSSSQVMNSGLNVAPTQVNQSVVPNINQGVAAMPETPQVSSQVVDPSLNVTPSQTEQTVLPSINQGVAAIPEEPQVSPQVVDPSLNVTPSQTEQTVSPGINQGVAAMPETTQSLSQEANFDVQQINQGSLQNVENVAPDKNGTAKSGKSTMIFVIVLFGLVALFIIGLPFLIKLGG